MLKHLLSLGVIVRATGLGKGRRKEWAGESSLRNDIF